MDVFLSWSGNRANEYAKALHKWLPELNFHIKPILSSVDIGPGTDWAAVLSKQLNAGVGVICLTRKGLGSQWISFEAGALWKALNERLVIPLLFDVAVDEIGRHPLQRFQCKIADDVGMFHVVQTINEQLDPDDRNPFLKKQFARKWPRLKKQLDRIRHMVTADEIEEPPGLNLWRPPLWRPVTAHLRRTLKAGGKPSLSIYDINGLAPLHSAFEELRELLRGGGSFRLLTLDPRRPAYGERSQLEGDQVGRIAHEHRASFHIVADLLRQSGRGTGEGVELRLSPTKPHGALILLDPEDPNGVILTNEYPTQPEMRGLAVPWYRYTSDDPALVKQCRDKFEALWNGAVAVRLREEDLEPPAEWPFEEI